MLTGVKETISAISEAIGGAVVGVGRRGHVGSGVVIADNTVLTNAHNIHSRQVAVTFGDGRTETGDVTGLDADSDVAVVSVDTGDVAPVVWSDAPVDLGSPVVGLSNPGGRGLRVTVGYVSGVDRTFRGPRGRRISGSIEHTAPLLPGSSGGPIVDEAGRLLGINTNRLGEGFYLAIAAGAELQGKVDKLADGLPDATGVLIRGVADDGPAAAAGIAEGDMVVKVADRDIAEVDDLHEALDAASPGEELALTLLRGTDELQVTVVIPEA